MLKKNKRLPEIKRLERDVLQCIIGQDKQVRQIITAIYRAKNFKTIKSNVLIIGNSGTGKTATIEQIAKRLHIPYTIEDATKYTQEGYYGADVNDMIYNLLENAQNDFERAQNGIIIIDEIDKISRKGDGPSITRDVSGEGVQQALLKIIEGTIANVPPQGGRKHPQQEFLHVDTKNILFICGGAFAGLEKIVEKHGTESGNSIGFGAKVEKDEKTIG